MELPDKNCFIVFSQFLFVVDSTLAVCKTFDAWIHPPKEKCTIGMKYCKLLRRTDQNSIHRIRLVKNSRHSVEYWYQSCRWERTQECQVDRAHFKFCASALSNHQDQQLIILWLLSSETVNVEKYQKYLGIHDCCVVSYLNESACQEPSDYQFSLDILILVTDNWPWHKLVHH